MRQDGKAPTLRAEMHGNIPCVMKACYDARGNNDQYLFQPIAVATQQGGAEITQDGICPTITAAAGMGGNNQPWICSPVTYDARGNGEGGWHQP